MPFYITLVEFFTIVTEYKFSLTNSDAEEDEGEKRSPSAKGGQGRKKPDEDDELQ